MGVLATIAERLGVAEKPTTLRTVTVKVKMDCEGCERKVRNALLSMRGAHTVVVDRKQHRAEVTGYVEPKDVLRRLRAAGKRAEIWPYIEVHLATHPCAPGAYDLKAPPGHVRKVDVIPGPTYMHGLAITETFSDDNPNSCSIM